ncbi:MAG TPA: rhamnulokinase family protein [Mycobacteriales bacterium]|nr:rhamnulokinase family protein [Mycobacteriales bacterium]
MSGPLALAAVDLGASSGRVVLGRIGPDTLELTEVSRFRNGPVPLPDGLYWDALGLYLDVLDGVRAAERRSGGLAGLAIDSWGVDYGLLDADGMLLGNPRHYRDDRTATVLDGVHRKLDPARLYELTGAQFLPFSTLYQLAAEPRLGAGWQALLMPDLLGYWLTGVRAAEQTNASTTGLLDAHAGDWAPEVVEGLGLPAGLLPDVVPAGRVLAGVTGPVRAELGLDHELLVSTVGSHDTASAVVGVPAATPRFGYVSCGTWGLVGVELDAPVLTEASRRANFTNERGVDGTIRYLRNVMGLWLLSESLRTWNLRGRGVELGAVLAAAAALPPGGPRIDPDDPAFLPPGDMPARIALAAERPIEDSPEVVVRCIVDSLALAFAAAIDDAERLSGQPVEVVHLVGGGARNALLCQLTADAAGRPVLAGPVEATALGNLLVQARTHGALGGDLAALRTRVRAATHLDRYEPRT